MSAVALAFELPSFLLGLLFGSFLNVCISRLPGHRSIATPRSRCPHCGQTIRWHDNIPLFSFILLRARCRHCQSPISGRYPIVELLTGLWLAYIASDALRIGPHWAASQPDGLSQAATFFLGAAILGFLLIGLLFMDWETHKLPDAFTVTGIAIGFFLTCVQAVFLAPGEGDIHLNPRNQLRMSSPGSMSSQGNVFLTGPEHLVFGRLSAIVGAALVLIVIGALYKALRHRQGLGFGDAKLLAMIAAFLGFWHALFALFLGVLLCAAYAVTLLARRRANTQTRLPLGAFLAIGGLLSTAVGDLVLTWYRSLL